MILSKTPLRISFAGGGTDFPKFFQNNNYGAVLSTSINKYIYVIVNKLQTLRTVMGHTTSFNNMKRLLLLLIIPLLSFGQREVVTKKAQEINNIFVLTDNRNTSLIDNRFEDFYQHVCQLYPE